MKMATAKLQSVLHAADGEAIGAFVADAAARALVSEAGVARGWPAQAVQNGDLATATEYTAEVTAPKIMLVELSSSEQGASGIVALARNCPPDTVIIGIGDINDVELYRQLLEAGLSDYLVKPLNEAALNRALDRADRIVAGEPEESNLGKLVTVIGARGGVGASTIAVNTAWLMAQEQGQHTALLDMDLYFGTSALALDLLPGRGLREALENPSRIDTLFVASAMVNVSENLFILAGEEPLEEDILFDPSALDQLLDELRQTFQRIVIDLPRSMALSHREILAGSSEIIVVADQSLAAVRDTMRLITMVKDLAPEARIIVATNRIGGKKQDALSKADFERGIEHQIDFTVPDEPKSVIAAVNAGKALPAFAKSSKVSGAMRELAFGVTGRKEVKKPGGFLRRRKSKK